MSKRKANKEKRPKDESDEDEEMEDIVNVEFEFFDPQPQDYLAIKRLLGQLFDADAELFHLPDLTELILSQPLLGSTVKVDGHETDPYAFLTVMNMNFHKSHRAIKALREYFLTMTKQDAAFSSQLTKLLNADSKGSDVGLVLSERMINMPVQIAPPMYRMLNEEIEWANDDKEPYQFDWYLLVSKVYRETASTADDEVMPSKKKRTKTGAESIPFFFHPEDEFIEKHATHSIEYKYKKQQQHSSDSRASFDDFGIVPGGKIMLISSKDMNKVVESLEQACL